MTVELNIYSYMSWIKQTTWIFNAYTKAEPTVFGFLNSSGIFRICYSAIGRPRFIGIHVFGK